MRCAPTGVGVSFRPCCSTSGRRCCALSVAARSRELRWWRPFGGGGRGQGAARLPGGLRPRGLDRARDRRHRGQIQLDSGGACRPLQEGRRRYLLVQRHYSSNEDGGLGNYHEYDVKVEGECIAATELSVPGSYGSFDPTVEDPNEPQEVPNPPLQLPRVPLDGRACVFGARSVPRAPPAQASRNAKTPPERGFRAMPEEGLEPPTRGL